jgi:glycosyltransferase involved in cell wall biosynthesis
MACGLPICGVNDGAMGEITAPGENSLLIPSEEDAFWKRRTYDTGQLADNIHSMVSNLDSYSANARKVAVEKFSLDDMTARYLQLF